MKIEWLVADVTAVRTPDKEEHDIFGAIDFGLFWLIQAISVVRE